MHYETYKGALYIWDWKQGDRYFMKIGHKSYKIICSSIFDIHFANETMIWQLKYHQLLYYIFAMRIFWYIKIFFEILNEIKDLQDLKEFYELCVWVCK